MDTPEDNSNNISEFKNSELDSENNQPIQIFVFPPKNKKFRLDEKTNSIQIEPLSKTDFSEEHQNEMDTSNVDISESKNYITTENNSTFQEPQEDESLEKNQTETSCGNEELTDSLHENNIEIKEILKIGNSFKNKRCFLKGCKWSPDGLCLLSNSEDHNLRLFEIPENATDLISEDIQPILTAKEGGIIYDYEWYPKMNSSDPVSCVFASTSQSSPIHLWDAYTGCLRATYQPINQYDEVTAAYSLAFSPDGCKLYSGFKKCVRIFDLSMPGRVSEERNLKVKKNFIFQTNIISCISINPVMPNVYALGSYDRTIGIYTEPNGELQFLLKGHKGGLTQIMFSQDGLLLYSGGRKDSEIICWDLRNIGKILFIVNRKVNTNQRIYFDLSNEGSYLVTGSTDHKIIIYDTKRMEAVDDVHLKPEAEWIAHEDCVNGVSFHPFHSLLASSSGQHHFSDLLVDDEENSSLDKVQVIENSIKIWSLRFNNQEKYHSKS